MQSIQLASSPYYHKSIEKAREMIQAHIAQWVYHDDDDVAPVGWTDWYSMGKPKDMCSWHLAQFSWVLAASSVSSSFELLFFVTVKELC